MSLSGRARRGHPYQKGCYFKNAQKSCGLVIPSLTAQAAGSRNDNQGQRDCFKRELCFADDRNCRAGWSVEWVERNAKQLGQLYVAAIIASAAFAATFSVTSYVYEKAGFVVWAIVGLAILRASIWLTGKILRRKIEV
jgi:hypothetical protein